MLLKFMIFGALAATSPDAPSRVLSRVPPAPATTSAQQEVRIPFAPPLGHVLRYRLKHDRPRSGRLVHSEAVLAVTFSRSGPDYLMSVHLELPPGLPAPDPTSAVSRIFSLPTEFRLDASGRIVEVVDLDRHWATALAVLRETPGMVPDARTQAAVEEMVRQVRALPPEQQLEMFAGNVAPIVAAAGGTFRVGETLSDSGQARSIAGTFTQSSTYRLDQADGRAAHITTRSAVPSEALEAQTRALAARLAPGREIGDFHIVSNETVETLEVSVLTGLAERYRMEKTLVVEENRQQRRVLELLTLELEPERR